MTLLAIGTGLTVLAVVGLAVGLLVLVVVIRLLNDVLAPLRRILTDLQSARTAPMLERGVPGTEQLAATRRLAESVPDLALAYLQKLSLPARPAEPAASAAEPASTAAPAQAQSAPEPTQPDDAALPAWKRYRG
jgi:hypothetical protein